MFEFGRWGCEFFKDTASRRVFAKHWGRVIGPVEFHGGCCDEHDDKLSSWVVRVYFGGFTAGLDWTCAALAAYQEGESNAARAALNSGV